MKRLAAAFFAACLFAPVAMAETYVDPMGQVLADPKRPAEDVARDANRHPSELLAFAGVKAGDVVADWVPGGGYFTRLFALVAGDSGTIYAWVPAELKDKYDLGKSAEAVATEFTNVTAVIEPMLATTSIKDADVVWTSQNYHDLYNEGFGKPDIGAFNRQVFNMLKPGGVYIIVDHVAAAGAPMEVTDTLHRIDPAIVKQEVEAAGFVFEGESDVLRNPADNHTLNVFDEKIRGKTDQFVYKFRKPAA